MFMGRVTFCLRGMLISQCQRNSNTFADIITSGASRQACADHGSLLGMTWRSLSILLQKSWCVLLAI